MRTLGCEESRALLSDALAGEISRPDANLLEVHLAACGPCAGAAEELAWQDRVISELAAESRAGAMMQRIRARIAALPQEAFDGEPASATPARFGRPAWAAAAAAILVAVGAAFLWRPAKDPVEVVVLPPARTLPRPDLPEPELREPADIRPLPEPPVESVPAPEPARTAKVRPPEPEPEVLPAIPRRNQVAPPEPPAAVPAPPKPPVRVAVEEVPAKPRSLDEAVRSGVAFLKARAATMAKDAKAEELVLLSLFHGGVPEADPEFQRLLKQVLEKKLERTYNVALQAVLLEELDRAKYQVRLLQCGQFLVDNQCLNGQWSYGDPSIFVDEVASGPLARELAASLRKGGVREFGADPKVTRKLPVKKLREGPAAGDNSNSQIAALGLRAVHEAGIVLPREVLELGARWWRESQTRSEPKAAPGAPPAPEGWCYGKHDHKPYGSMTAGGVGSLVIYDYLLGRDWKRDREVAAGMAWLGKHFSVDYNPGPYEHAAFAENTHHHLAYYLYALERAAILYGTPEIGRQDWFGAIAPALLAKQRADGAFVLKGGEILDTCYSVLFLRKSTRSLPDTASGPRK